MEKISISKLRANGFTAFEAEVINYALVNNLEVGTTFVGVPNHPRYGTSKEVECVIEFNSEKLTIERGGKKTITVKFADYSGSERKTTTTTKKTETEVKNNNNNNIKTENKMETNNNTNNNVNTNNNGMDILNSLFAQQQEIGYQRAINDLQPKIEELKKAVETAKQSGSGTVINVTIDGKTTTTKTEKVLDKQFAKVLKYVSNGENVYLYGPAGSGKNVIGEEVAKALNLPFHYQNTILTKFDVSGYKNAKGEFEQTPFYKAWKFGGLYFPDELDNSQAEAIIALNAALANGYYTFADTNEKVAKHPNFRCIAAGNTNGQGATEEYCGRYQMDESSRDRFVFVKIDYNTKVEESITKHSDILEFVRALRVASGKLQIKLICGYRGITKLDKYYDEEAVDCLNDFIYKGMSIDDIRQLYYELKDSVKSDNKYLKATEEIIK